MNVDLAFYLPWDGKMSRPTTQKAVMLCGCGAKAGMACLQTKLCVAISERFRKCIGILRRFTKCPGLLYLLCIEFVTVSVKRSHRTLNVSVSLHYLAKYVHGTLSAFLCHPVHN